MTSLARRIGMALILAAVTFTAYSFMVNDSFKTMDDEYCIVHNQEIRDLKNAGRIFTHEFFGAGSYYRPLVSFTFMLEYHFFGLNPFFYYLDNVAWHIATSLLLFLLLCQILRREAVAFAVSLLFAIHPVHWEAVSNIPGRAILLSSFFSVAAFLFFCWREKGKGFWPAALLCFALGLLSKEAAVVLPFVLAAYQGLVVGRKGQKWRAVWFPVLPFLMVEVLYLVVRSRLGISKLFYWNNLPQAALGFLTFLRSLITHIRVMFFPYDLHFDRSCRVFTHFTDPGLLLTVIFWGGFLFLLCRYWRQMTGASRFFVCWFFIEFLPVSQIGVSIGVQPGYISAAEHFLYMPAIGFLALAVLAGEKFYQLNQGHRWVSFSIAKFFVVVVYAAFFITTVEQNIYSSNEVAMFERTVRINPTNSRVRYNLGYVYAQKKLFAYAEREFRKVVELNPDMVNARIALGKSLCDQGKYWEGIREYDRIQDAGDLKALLDGNRQVAYQRLADSYRARIRENSDDAPAHYSLGVVYSKTGRLAEAIASYGQAVALKPDFRDALFNLASASEAQGDERKAREMYERFLNLPAKDDMLKKIALQHLGEIYQKQGANVRAAEYFEKVKTLTAQGL